MRKIIVTADDFGMSAEVNRASVERLETNVVPSTTLMASMPGFDDACELAHPESIGTQLWLEKAFPYDYETRQEAAEARQLGDKPNVPGPQLFPSETLWMKLE